MGLFETNFLRAPLTEKNNSACTLICLQKYPFVVKIMSQQQVTKKIMQQPKKPNIDGPLLHVF